MHTEILKEILLSIADEHTLQRAAEYYTEHLLVPRPLGTAVEEDTQHSKVAIFEAAVRQRLIPKAEAAAESMHTASVRAPMQMPEELQNLAQLMSELISELRGMREGLNGLNTAIAKADADTETEAKADADTETVAEVRATTEALPKVVNTPESAAEAEVEEFELSATSPEVEHEVQAPAKMPLEMRSMILQLARELEVDIKSLSTVEDIVLALEQKLNIPAAFSEDLSLEDRLRLLSDEYEKTKMKTMPQPGSRRLSLSNAPSKAAESAPQLAGLPKFTNLTKEEAFKRIRVR